MAKGSGTTRASGSRNPQGLKRDADIQQVAVQQMRAFNEANAVGAEFNRINSAIENSYDIKLNFSKAPWVNDGEEDYPIKEIEVNLGGGYSALFQDRPSEARGRREIDVNVTKDGANINRFDVTIDYDGSRGGLRVAENRATSSIRDILNDYRRRR